MDKRLLDEDEVMQICFVTDDVDKSAQWFADLTGKPMPSLGKAAAETPLPSPTVFSVEPGVYLDGEMGVRIEDLVAIDLAARRIDRLTAFPREPLVVGP